MSEERGDTGGGGGGGAVVVSDHDIAAELELLICNNPTITTFSGVVQHLETRLGLDLSHKIDFIRCQIQLLLQRQTQQCPIPPPIQHQKDYYVFQQNDVFQPPQTYVPPQPLVSQFVFQSPRFGVSGQQQYVFQPPPPQQTRIVSPLPSSTSAVDAEASKDSAPSGKKRKGGSGGLNKVCGVSPELQAIVGQETMPRTEIVKQLWAYIRKHNLQDPTNKRKIICNDGLRVLFETDSTDMFKMNKLLAKHILPLEPSKETGQTGKQAKTEVVESAKTEVVSAKIEGDSAKTEGDSAKKEGASTKTEAESTKTEGDSANTEVESAKTEGDSAKTEVESGSVGLNSVPNVVISAALANFFGTAERKMSVTEIYGQMWEYIKNNQLEDPLNSMTILCDGRLQELFGSECISILEIQQKLSQDHIILTCAMGSGTI